jgi:four helix bundle suffix protein
MSYKSNRGGYQSLIVYWLATNIFDLTSVFCNKYISKSTRTHDQMVQAARSGKQCIVEGSLENSVESNLKLTGVSRASYGELIEDYRDFLRIRNLNVWDVRDSRVIIIRRTVDIPYKSYMSYKTYMTYTQDSESFPNLMITLCYKQSYMLDRLLKSIREKFIKEGGLRENLHKDRLRYRNSVKI